MTGLDVEAAISRGEALVHVATQQAILRAAAELQLLDLAAFIDACSRAQTVAPFFDPTAYLANLHAGDPLEKIRELATLAKALGDALPRTCRVCGCTVERACEGGCSWVAPGLCSSCRPSR